MARIKDELGRWTKDHGMSYPRLYEVWHAMKQRCENPNCKSYKNYGARGISACKAWHGPSQFIEWALANGYQNDLTIERKDVNGDYDPYEWTLISRLPKTTPIKKKRGLERAYSPSSETIIRGLLTTENYLPSTNFSKEA